MEFTVSDRRRVALLWKRIDTMIDAVRTPSSWMSDLAVGLVSAKLGWGAHIPSEYSDIDLVSQAAAQYLIIIGEFQLMAWGEHVIYYPEGTSEHITNLLRAKTRNDDTTRGGKVFQISDLTEFANYQLDPYSNFERERVAQEDYLTLEAIWRDAITQNFTQCVRLILFADETRWRSELNEVKQVARRLHDNPALVLPGEQLDRVAWALTGAEDLLEEESITWSAAWHLFRAGAAPDRVGQLTEVRTDLYDLRDILTSDGGWASAQWLRRQTESERNPSTGPAGQGLRPFP